MFLLALSLAVEWLGSILEAFRGWQTAFGAFLGFVGVIAAGSWNARHARRKADKEYRLEQIATVTALYSEIVALRVPLSIAAAEVGRRYLAWAYGEDGFDPILKQPYTKAFQDRYQIPSATIFNAFTSKIGTLPPDIAKGLIIFYSDYEAARRYFPLLLEIRTEGHSPGLFLNPAVNALGGVMVTLRAIEDFSVRPAFIDDVDISLALDALDRITVAEDHHERALRAERDRKNIPTVSNPWPKHHSI